jgi:DNA-binding transcriptional LysR family regulator
MVNFRQLEYFKAAATELNFTKAAARLHIAQPPLSRQIKLLEEDLGVTLFKRGKTGVQLTNEALYLQKELAFVFDRLERIRQTIGTIHRGHDGILSVGYVGAAMHSLLPAILHDFSKDFPNVSVQLHEMDNGQQVNALLNGIISVGFLRSKVDNDEIDFHLINEESFSLVTPRAVRIDRRLRNLAVLNDLPFIAFPLNCAPEMVTAIYSVLDKMKLRPSRIHESSQINSIVRIVDSGTGYSILPSSATRGYKLSVNTVDLAGFKGRARLYAGALKENNEPQVSRLMKLIVSRFT